MCHRSRPCARVVAHARAAIRWATACGWERNGWWPVSSSTTDPARWANSRRASTGVPRSKVNTSYVVGTCCQAAARTGCWVTDRLWRAALTADLEARLRRQVNSARAQPPNREEVSMSNQLPDFGTLEWYERFLNRFDSVTVQIAFVDHPSQAPREVMAFDVSTGAQGWKRDWLTNKLLDLCRDDKGMQRYPNVLQIEQRYHGWGAAGARETILLQVGIDAFNLLFQESVRSLVREIRARGGGAAANTSMDRDSAVDRARRRISISYTTTSYAELAVIFESQDIRAETWEVHLKDATGYRYEVVIKTRESYDTIRLSRTAPNS